MEDVLHSDLPVIDKPKCSNGYVFRFLFAFIFVLCAVGMLTAGFILLGMGYADFFPGMFIGIGSGLAVIATLLLIGAIKGRTKKWANNISIVIGAIFCVGLIGIFGVVGGVRGKRALDDPEKDLSTCKISGDKDVARYRAHTYAFKASCIWAGFFIYGSLVLTPFFTAGLMKYKKRYKVFFALYIVTLIMVIASVLAGVMYQLKYYDYHTEYIYNSRMNYSHSAYTATEAASYRNLLTLKNEVNKKIAEMSVYYDRANGLYRDIQNEEKGDYNNWKAEYIASYNEIYNSVKSELWERWEYDDIEEYDIKEFYNLSDTDKIYDFFNDSKVYVEKYNIDKSYVAQLYAMSDDVSYNYLCDGYEELCNALTYKKLLSNIQTKLNGFRDIDERAVTVFDEDFKQFTREKYAEYLELVEKSEKIQLVVNICFVVASALAGIMGVCIFGSLFSMLSLVHNNIYIKAVEKEVEKSEGVETRTNFRKSLLEKAKAKDTEGFIATLTVAHENYEKRKALILDDKTFKLKLGECVAAVAKRSGKDKAAEFKKQCVELFENYDFEALDLMFASVDTIEEPEAETAVAGAESVTNSVDTDSETEKTEIEKAEYIKPKTSEKAKKGIMIAISAMYGALLLFGILIAAIPSASGPVISGMGICNELCNYAYAVVIGVFMVATVPSVMYYFGMMAPVKLEKKFKTIITAVGLGLSVVMTIVFFVVLNCAPVEGMPIPPSEYLEGSDSWFVPASMVFAQLGIIVCYALLLFRINPDKIKDVKPTKEGDKIADMMKHVLMLIAYGVLKGVKAVLKFKEARPEIFILVATALFTWLAFFTSFVAAIIIIAVLVAVIVMVFCKLVDFGYTPSAPREKIVVEDEFGQKIELEESPYEVGRDRYEKVYHDQTGKSWYSENGKDFRNDDN